MPQQLDISLWHGSAAHDISRGYDEDQNGYTDTTRIADEWAYIIIHTVRYYDNQFPISTNKMRSFNIHFTLKSYLSMLEILGFDCHC